MGKKETSYQRLKRENLELKQDIYSLVKEPNKVKSLSVTLKWKFIFDAEEVLWQGGTSTNNG